MGSLGPVEKFGYRLILDGIIELMFILLGMIHLFWLCTITSFYGEECWVIEGVFVIYF